MPRNPEVNAWMQDYENPQKATVEKVRSIILATDQRITECIKWQSPTFVFGGNMASFNPRSKAHASLMFHTGAKIPGPHPLLEGGGGTARFMKFSNVADAEAKREALQDVVRAWIRLQSAGAPDGESTRASAKKASAKKV